MPSTRSNSRPKAPLSPNRSAELRAEWSFDAIGTAWWIGVYELPAALNLMDLKERIAARIQAFDITYSRFRDDSLVAMWSRHAGVYDLPPDAAPLLNLYHQLYALTAGAVTPLIGNVMSDAGYDAAYTLQAARQLTSPPAWDEAIEFDSTAGRIHVKQPVLMDFGAIGKGYLVDIICELLESAGVKQYCVDAGGDIRVRLGGDVSPLGIGLENPTDTTQAIGVARMRRGAICGSAGNRRAWQGYHHIIDPHKLESPRHLQAVWVSAESAMVADGLTTALYFVAPDKLCKGFTFEFAMVHTGSRVEVSSGFPGEFFTASDQSQG